MICVLRLKFIVDQFKMRKDILDLFIKNNYLHPKKIKKISKYYNSLYDNSNLIPREKNRLEEEFHEVKYNLEIGLHFNFQNSLFGKHMKI